MSQEDRAQEEEAFRWELANKPRPAETVYKPGDKEYGPEFCANDECGDLMPNLRRAMGKTLCTDCQSTAEIRAKRRY